MIQGGYRQQALTSAQSKASRKRATGASTRQSVRPVAGKCSSAPDGMWVWREGAYYMMRAKSGSHVRVRTKRHKAAARQANVMVSTASMQWHNESGQFLCISC